MRFGTPFEPLIMYAPHFGLKREPFSIAPDPRYLFMSERHREALAHLLYGVRAGGGFVLLTGEIGAGKTTVCRCFLEQVPKRCNVAYIFNPRLTVEELLKSVCEEFHVPLPVRAEGAERPTVTDYLDPLNEFLLATHSVGQNNVLIIDEAQQLSAEVLEQLRLLTNLETSQRKLLQVILIGQPELRAVLARPELEQLAQRVIARYHLQAMTEAETLQYVAHRLSVAGMKRAPPFSTEALQLVHKLSRGVPRRINLLCDRAMLGAYATGRSRIGRQIVQQAAAEVFDAPADTLMRSLNTAPAATGRLGRVAQPARWPRAAQYGAAALGGAALFALGSWGLTRFGASPDAPTHPAITAGSVPGPGAVGAAAASGANPGGNASGRPNASPGAGAAGPTASDSPNSSADATATARGGPAVPAAPPTGSAAGPVGSPVPADGAALPRTATTEEAAWLALAAAWKLPTQEGDACQVAQRRGLQCYRTRLTWPLLRLLDRPGILTLREGNGPARYALLEAASAQKLRVRIGGVPQELTAKQLRAQWDGEFSTIWRPPPGYTGQVDGRDSAAGKWISAKLDSLPGGEASGAAIDAATPPGPAAREAAFTARLRSFQRAQGLAPDGVAGPATLMQLNRAAGIDEPRLAPLTVAAESVAVRPTTDGTRTASGSRAAPGHASSTTDRTAAGTATNDATQAATSAAADTRSSALPAGASTSR